MRNAVWKRSRDWRAGCARFHMHLLRVFLLSVLDKDHFISGFNGWLTGKKYETHTQLLFAE